MTTSKRESEGEKRDEDAYETRARTSVKDMGMILQRLCQ